MNRLQGQYGDMSNACASVLEGRIVYSSSLYGYMENYDTQAAGAHLHVLLNLKCFNATLKTLSFM